MSHDAHALRWQPAWLAAGWLLVAAVVYLSLTPAPPEVDLPQGDKFAHVLAYAVLMFWFSQLYEGSRTRVLIALGFVCLGIVLEWLQGVGGARAFEVQDMIANAGGVALGWVAGPPRSANVLLRIERLVSI